MRGNKSKSFQFELVGAGQPTLLLKQISQEGECLNLNNKNNLNIIKIPQRNKLNKSYMCRLRKQFAEHQQKLNHGCKEKQNLSVDQIKDKEGKGYWPKFIYQPNNYEQKRFKSQPVQQMESDGFCFPDLGDTNAKNNQIPAILRFPQINEKRYQITQEEPKERKNLNFIKILYPQSIYMQGKAIK